MALKPQAIELHIEELVLDGFSGRDRFAIGDALQEELSRLIAEKGLSEIQGPASIDHVKAGSFPAAPDTREKALGTEVARAVNAKVGQALLPALSPARTTH